MTASSELRAAATKLRGAAKALIEEVRPPQQPLMWFDEELLIGSTITGGDADPLDHALTRAEVTWLTLAHPCLIEPLATALDLLADRWDTHDPVLDAMHQHDETAVGHHLLVIARQINGGGS